MEVLPIKIVIKGIVIFLVLFFIFSITGIVLNTTITELKSASNTTGVYNQTWPIYDGINTVFTALATIFGVSVFVLVFAVVFSGRDEYDEQKY